jgi:hypothetical protein
MAQDSRNIENQERGGNAAGSNHAPPMGILRIDTSRIREKEEPVIASPNGESGGAQAGPGNGGGSQGQSPGLLSQDSLSLMQLKRLVGEGGRIVVSLVWVFSLSVNAWWTA